MLFAAMWMGLQSVLLSEGSQRSRNIIWHPLYVESKKKWYKWTYKIEADSQTLRMRLWGWGWGESWGEGIVKEFGMVLYTLLYLKWITNKDLLNIVHGTLISVMWQPGWEGSLEENVWLSPFSIHLKLSQLC